MQTSAAPPHVIAEKHPSPSVETSETHAVLHHHIYISSRNTTSSTSTTVTSAISTTNIMETLHAAGASRVTIHHHGAHVTSWTDSRGTPKIFTSPTAHLDGSKAIRGGIPICFPQFGKQGPLPQHGFARNLLWTPDPTRSTPTSTCFLLHPTPATLSSTWPHLFTLAYTVSLSPDGDTLTTHLHLTNNDQTPITFTTALHTYYACDALNTTLPTLHATTYTDSLSPTPTTPVTQSGPVAFASEVDRIYRNTPDTITIPSANLTITKTNLPDAVVWNPHIEKSKAMADLPDDAYKSFICIEPARITQPATVQPGDSWSCQVVHHSASPST